jgi:uncharacterized SAM-binding protein YcdF (DUF218 family)
MTNDRFTAVYSILKLLISPLPWLLAICVIRALAGLRSPGTKASMKLMDSTLLLFSLATGLLSAPFVSDLVAASLSFDASRHSARNTVVVVLAGGSFLGADGRYHLATATTDRVLAGVQVYGQSSARRMVMSGQGVGDGPWGEAGLMAELAVHLGIPADRILLDPLSLNTFEHPRRLLRAGLASPSDDVIVVTEPIHARRALLEFRRTFPFARPATTPDHAPAGPAQIQSWIPQLPALSQSSRSLAEWVGIAWYAVKHLVQDRGTTKAVVRAEMQIRDAFPGLQKG